MRSLWAWLSAIPLRGLTETKRVIEAIIACVEDD
jgi:hypothetical protein